MGTTTIPRSLKAASRAVETAQARAIDAAQPQYKPNALQVFNLRYPRKGLEGQPTETPAEVHWRIAVNVASPTILYAAGADWAEGDEEPVAVDAATLPFPFRTVVRQYNWLLAHGRKLKEFSALVTLGQEAWLGRAELYYNELLVPLRFIPNSPTWTGAGTPLGQLAACFVLPVEDSLVSGESNIMQTLTDAVAIQKTGGGNGFSFGRLRPAGSIVSTSMGESTGIVGFLRAYNSVFEEIRQGGSRRGANMGVCPVWHPDVIKFIESKVVEGEIANFNISVAVTDRFMQAVETEASWGFHFPGPDGPIVEVEWKGEKVKSIPALELWEFITNNAHVLGDPGALFIDTANRYNPTPKHYTLESTNPCGEQWLGPYENCCLGSIAVQAFVHEGVFDWEAFREAIVLSTEFLDDVVDANAYVVNVPQLEVAAQGGRRIGLGLMGLADTLILMGQRYSSPDGLDFASQLMEFVRFHTMKASIGRAAARGPFPRIQDSVYDADLILQHGWGSKYSGTMVDGETPFTGYLWESPHARIAQALDFGRPECNWEEVREEILQSGIRNSCQTTFAPTGTIATTAGVEGYGCEPIFALAYSRTVMQEAENVVLSYPSEFFERMLVEAGLNEEERQTITEKVAANEGSCQGILEVPEHIRHIMVTAGDLSGIEHVLMQAALQDFVDNSLSKTINFRNEATVEEVAEVYRKAWELGCKGVTIYRQGSRDLEVLSTSSAGATGTVEIVDQEHWPLIRPLPIPVLAEIEGLPSWTHTVQTPFGKMRLTTTHLPDYPDRIFDVSVSIGRGGNDINALAEATARVVSMGLRAGVPVEVFTDQLIGIGGSTQESTLRPDRAKSLPDAFGKGLLQAADQLKAAVHGAAPESAGNAVALADRALKGNGSFQGSICPECKQATVLEIQGCKTCDPNIGGCGHSVC